MDNDNSIWIYKYSETLKQTIAFNRKTYSVHCEDGTDYSPYEYSVIKKSGKQIPLQVHLIKKVFSGTIV